MNKQISFSLVACLLVSAGTVSATSYTGSISVGNGLTVGGAWASATGGSLSWLVDDTTNSGFWTYTYTFTIPGVSPDISHAIIEVTDGATIDDFAVTNGDDNEVDTFSPGNSNFGMPGDIFGIKVNTPGNTDEPWTWSIVTERGPVWQDFYAKAGNPRNGGFAYNSGFLATDPTAGPSNGSIDGHILGPNGTRVPDGGITVSLMGLALGGLGMLRRFMRKA